MATQSRQTKGLAHIIRKEGNEAAHDEAQYTESEAKQLQEYTEVCFTYVFTIPNMLAKVQAVQT